MNFGPQFQAFLRKRNLTQVRAAMLLGWSQNTVSYYCRSAAEPHGHVLQHMSRTFGCSVYDIIGTEAVAETAVRLRQKRTANRQQVVMEQPAQYFVDPWTCWGGQLRAAWKKDQARVELAVRAAWPKPMAEEIIAWLASKK